MGFTILRLRHGSTKGPFLLVAALRFVRGVFEVSTAHEWDRDLSKLTSIFRVG